MFWKYNYQGITWALFILLLSGLPGDQFDKAKIENADAVVHTIMYGVLFYLLSVGFIKQTSSSFLKRKTLRKVFVLCVAYGIVVEILQGTIFIQRSIEASDMMFNMLGTLVGMGFFISVYGWREYI